MRYDKEKLMSQPNRLIFRRFTKKAILKGIYNYLTVRPFFKQVLSFMNDRFSGKRHCAHGNVQRRRFCN